MRDWFNTHSGAFLSLGGASSESGHVIPSCTFPCGADRGMSRALFAPCVAMSMRKLVHVSTAATDCPLVHEATVLTHGSVLAVWRISWVTLIISVYSLPHARLGAHARCAWLVVRCYDRSRSIRMALPCLALGEVYFQNRAATHPLQAIIPHLLNGLCLLSVLLGVNVI